MFNLIKSLRNFFYFSNEQDLALPVGLTYKKASKKSMWEMHNKLEIYNKLGQKIGEVCAHSTRWHFGTLIAVNSDNAGKQYLKINQLNEINKIYKKYIKDKGLTTRFNERVNEWGIGGEKIIERRQPTEKRNGIENKYTIEKEEWSWNKELRSAELDDTPVEGNNKTERENRYDVMRRRVESQNLEKGYNIKEFKEKWNGSVTNNALKIAWTHSERMTADLEDRWDIFRGWVNSQDNHVTIKDFTEKKAEFLALLRSNKQEYLNLFEFIQESIDSLTPKEDERLMKFMDEQVILRNKEDRPSPFIAFGNQMPKFFKRDLEGIYNTAEQSQVFSVIQDNFEDSEILSLPKDQYELRMEKVKKQIKELIDLSNAEAESLKHDIARFKGEERKLDNFIVNIFPKVMSKITFASAQGRCENEYLFSSKMTQAMSFFDEEFEKFLKKLKVDYPELNDKAEAALRKGKLLDYYTAKVDQMQNFLTENVKEKLSMLPTTKEASDKGYSAQKLKADQRFSKENISKLLTDTSAGAFIGSCRAALYRPEETKKRLENFIEFVDKKRQENNR